MAVELHFGMRARATAVALDDEAAAGCSMTISSRAAAGAADPCDTATDEEATAVAGTVLSKGATALELDVSWSVGVDMVSAGVGGKGVVGWTQACL